MARAHQASACLFAMVLLGGCPSSEGTPAATTEADTKTSSETSASTITIDGTSTTTTATAADATDTNPTEPLPCNGHVALCDRPFDQVIFAGTHNSHSARDDGFPPVNANQQHGIAQQLDDGIRVLLLDIYPDEADPSVVLMCHGPCSLASTPHLDGLAAITAFLQANPREVITIIYEDHVEASAVAQDYATTGAQALVFTHAPGEPWPTLGAMIDADTRLYVTAESGGPPPPWYHHVWNEAWDTPYGPSSAEDLSCDLNRGATDNDLFLVNHWVNDALGLPSASNAALVNAAEILQARAEQCQAQWDHAPNFLVVDFYEEGDLLAVVDALNGLPGA